MDILCKFYKLYNSYQGLSICDNMDKVHCKSRREHKLYKYMYIQSTLL